VSSLPDRDLGKHFPSILAAGGVNVERHCDLFPPDGTDEQWLEHCGKYHRIAITHDLRIRYKPNELEAVIKYGVGLLVVVGHAPYSELAKNFIATFPKIENFVDSFAPPFIAKVYRPTPSELLKNRTATGSVMLWYPR
jgi:hypothetical protein